MRLVVVLVALVLTAAVFVLAVRHLPVIYYAHNLVELVEIVLLKEQPRAVRLVLIAQAVPILIVAEIILTPALPVQPVILEMGHNVFWPL